jgi:hypothetical protein
MHQKNGVIKTNQINLSVWVLLLVSVGRLLTLCTKERNASASSISSGWRGEGDGGAASRGAATNGFGDVFGFFRRGEADAHALVPVLHSFVGWVDMAGACKMCSGWNRLLGRGKMPGRGGAAVVVVVVATSDSVSTRASWLG